MEIKDRVVVVTGGGAGIGRALCRRFAREGATAIIVADLDQSAAAAVAREIGGMAVVTDVTDESAVQRLVRQTLQEHDRLDIYCSNAGIAFGGGPEAPDEAWQRSWEVHVMAHVYAARAVVPAMLERGAGYIVGTVSAAGLLNHVLASPYATSKAAALSFFEWLAIAYGERGIRVSAICPQGVRTAMLAREGERSFLAAGAVEPEAVADSVVAAMREERFLVLPHPEVAEYVRRKAEDYDRWLRGMRRLRKRVIEAKPEPQ
jgi:NAD(P)-dependent dehydrogenase (short-subunit alcohol dehydrogenase family)